MEPAGGFGRCVLVIAVALALAAPLEGQERQPGEGPGIHRPGAMAGRRPGFGAEGLARLLADPRRPLELDPVALSAHLFRLEEGRKAELDRLAREREEEKRRLIDELNARYVEKVKVILTDEERRKLEGVLGALQVLRDELQRARDELAAGAGEEVAADARLVAAQPAMLIVRFLDLTPEQKARLTELQRGKAMALAQAQRAMKRPAAGDDREAWRQYREELRAATDQANEDYEAQVRQLLTPEQADQLAQIELALDAYRQRVQTARQTCIEELKGILGE